MTLVIAYGNPLRGDDGVGWAIGARIERDAAGFVVVIRQQLVPELAAQIAEASVVIFVDARCGGTPGEVRCTRLVRGPSGSVLGHSQGPEALLGLAADLFGREPQAYLVSVDVQRMDLGGELSRAVADAVPKACATIRTLAGECSPP